MALVCMCMYLIINNVTNAEFMDVSSYAAKLQTKHLLDDAVNNSHGTITDLGLSFSYSSIFDGTISHTILTKNKLTNTIDILKDIYDILILPIQSVTLGSAQKVMKEYCVIALESNKNNKNNNNSTVFNQLIVLYLKLFAINNPPITD